MPVEVHIFGDVEDGPWIVNYGSLVVEESRTGGLAAAMKVADAKVDRVGSLTGRRPEVVVHGVNRG